MLNSFSFFLDVDSPIKCFNNCLRLCDFKPYSFVKQPVNVGPGKAKTCHSFLKFLVVLQYDCGVLSGGKYMIFEGRKAFIIHNSSILKVNFSLDS